MFLSIGSYRFTPLDYAEKNNHPDCVDILHDLQGVAVGRIMEMAATSIQRTYRGYRYVAVLMIAQFHLANVAYLGKVTRLMTLSFFFSLLRRARLVLLKLRREYAAAVTIQKHVRGFLCRRRYRETRRQMSAATVIQASVRCDEIQLIPILIQQLHRTLEQTQHMKTRVLHSLALRSIYHKCFTFRYLLCDVQCVFRGFLQRNRYRKQRQLYREQRRKQKMIEDFSRMILYHEGGSLLKTITIPSELAPSEDRLSQRTGKEFDWQKSELNNKTEQALRMRALLLEQQKRWEEFRAAEKQRRIDKARQEELDRLHGVIADSQARRQHFKEKFRYTTVVRSRHHAAVIIQRAFRMAKVQREEKRRRMELESRRRLRTATRSAVIIQRAWRSHRAWKRYVEANFKSILTSPVVAVAPHQPHGTCDLTAPKSYERNTLVLGKNSSTVDQEIFTF